MIGQMIDFAGEELELLQTAEIEPGDPVLGRSAKSDELWVPFRAIISEPRISAETGPQAVRDPSESFEMHTELELEIGATVRRQGRRFRVTASSFSDRPAFVGRYMMERSNVG